ncbi:MAG: hypothetical protein M1825_005503 [Sarcosagium campestre]|nr:MAG: hypothetical protein M1825_005503 [Sarcosagium campestre]
MESVLWNYMSPRFKATSRSYFRSTKPAVPPSSAGGHMSSFLWRFFLEDDVESFRQVLAEAICGNPSSGQKGGGATAGSGGGHGLSGNRLNTKLSSSPKAISKPNKSSGSAAQSVSGKKGGSKWSNLILTRADINVRDCSGLTLLHHSASMSSQNAIVYATALIEHPLIDIYLQDHENGWTVLHRALYFGNIAVARAVLNYDLADTPGKTGGFTSHSLGRLTRVKDKEGNTPFDVFSATITSSRNLLRGTSDIGMGSRPDEQEEESEESSESDDSLPEGGAIQIAKVEPIVNMQGDGIFMFGSNKNLNLGFKDGDDRYSPELINICRPESLLQRFYMEYRRSAERREPHRSQKLSDPTTAGAADTMKLPFLIQHKALIIQDVVLSKLHTAIITNDPEANLYMCGFGPGGRLGMGDDLTRFTPTCIKTGGLGTEKVVNVGLGQNHTLAITEKGDLFTWGTSTCGQLGYALPRSTAVDDDPVQLVPRQVFGVLKRETVIAAAASRFHSVVHTAQCIYTFGKNEGQLGLVDSDARSLEFQATPRKVGASLFNAPIEMISAIERATICLSGNNVWIFSNYGYAKLAIPNGGFPDHPLLKDQFGWRPHESMYRIAKIASGGDTICAMGRGGDVYAVKVSQNLDPELEATSTTNPTKIRNALSQPRQIWSAGNSLMQARDVAVGQDGSVLTCTEAGSVWRRVKRASIKDTRSDKNATSRREEYKFTKIPGLTRVVGVRSNTFGAYAAVRKDCDVTRTQIVIGKQRLWENIGSLCPLHNVQDLDDESSEDESPRFWKAGIARDHFSPIKRLTLTARDLEQQIQTSLQREATHDASYDMEIGITASDVQIPVHRFILAGRSVVLRKILSSFCSGTPQSPIPSLAVRRGEKGWLQLSFQDVDFLTLLNLALYMYTDTLIDVWHNTRQFPKFSSRYRQVRVELMKLAASLQLRGLESAVRAMSSPKKCLDQDMEAAILDDGFFSGADALIQLASSEIRVHSGLMRRRCPFFEGLYHGRSGGGWLSDRRSSVGREELVRIDLRHIPSSTFVYVLRHLYCDTGEELFEDVVTDSLDDFFTLVIDVMSVANELMIDRLSQVCQTVLGKFGESLHAHLPSGLGLTVTVTPRNACELLGAVDHCSMTGFKKACLEYICLNLESMLENRLLDDLDDDLIADLDANVRSNQLVCMPFVKSGRAEATLHERFPQLAKQQWKELQSRIATMTNSSGSQDSDARPVDFDGVPKSMSRDRTRQKSTKRTSSEPDRAPLGSKSSTQDLIFHMDKDDDDGERSSNGNSAAPRSVASPQDSGYMVATGEKSSDRRACLEGEYPKGHDGNISLESRSDSFSRAEGTPDIASSNDRRAWKFAGSPLRLGMKEIMAQDAPTGLFQQDVGSIDASSTSARQTSGSFSAKLSQRERKKRSLQTAQSTTDAAVTAGDQRILNNQRKPSSPWSQPSMDRPRSPVTFPKMLPHRSTPSPVHPYSNHASPTSNLSRSSAKGLINQVALPKRSNQEVIRPSSNHHIPRRGITATDPGRHRRASSGQNPAPELPSLRSSTRLPRQGRSDAAYGVEASHSTIDDIINQQRDEQVAIKEFAAKRPLQEIQQEQEFMEWWDTESKRARDEEAREQRRSERGTRVSSSSSGKGKGRGRDRGGKGKGKGRAEAGGRADQLAAEHKQDNGDAKTTSLRGGRGSKSSK